MAKVKITGGSVSDTEIFVNGVKIPSVASYNVHIHHAADQESFARVDISIMAIELDLEIATDDVTIIHKDPRDA